MSEVRWAFLSNHGRVFCYLAKHPKSSIEVLARDAGLSVAGVHKIIDDLEESGYLVRQRVGRCNQYIIHPELPMRHHLEWDFTIGDILMAVGGRRLVEKHTASEGDASTVQDYNRNHNIPVVSH